MKKETRYAGVMIGAMGSGKSTIGEKIAKEKGWRYIDPDTYWKRDGTQEYTKELRNEIWAKAFAEIYKCIKSGTSFILNTASKTHTARREFCRVVRGHSHGSEQYDFKIIGYFIEASLETCIRRNKKREEQRPEEVVEEYYKQIQKEYPDEEEDEYDRLHTINNDKDHEWNSKLIQKVLKQTND